MTDLESTKTIGHEKQKALFEQARKNNRLAHAYALIGASNIGKIFFALDVASSLGVDPKLDVFLYDEPLGITIEQARLLQRQLSLTSVSGDYKVGIVAHADKMSRGAANSLLKLLEEPSAHTIIFLITENFYTLLPTIQSRVQRINFGRSKAQTLKNNFANDDLWNDFTVNFEALTNTDVIKRFQAAEQVIAYDHEQMQDFLRFAMTQWAASGGDDNIGQKLLSAFQDIKVNVNKKLVIDNLYI